MGRRQSDRLDAGDMHDVGYLRARAKHLLAAAATARDPEIARALRQVAADFDNEAAREEAEAQAKGNALQAGSGKNPAA